MHRTLKTNAKPSRTSSEKQTSYSVRLHSQAIGKAGHGRLTCLLALLSTKFHSRIVEPLFDTYLHSAGSWLTVALR